MLVDNPNKGTYADKEGNKKGMTLNAKRRQKLRVACVK